MIGKLILLSVAYCSSTTQGFVLKPNSPRCSPLRMSKVELNEVDEMCIENVAEFCLNEACDIEEYEALINQLQDQRDLMTEHVAKVTSLLARLQGHEFEVTEGTKDAETLMQSVGNTLELDGFVTEEQ